MRTARLAPRLFTLLASLLLTLAAGNASAQADYRWIDPVSGRTVFSDQPPPPGARRVQSRGSSDAALAGEGGETPLPFATKQAASKYPVKLYTAASCVEPCAQARALLNARGVPFSEKMLQNDAEAAELRERGGGGEIMVPSITVGSQFYRGFEAGSWNNLLDLAGYPGSAAPGSKAAGAFAR
ncbi:glutaredoxin family protein [Rhodocyclus tenuis]|uniref:Glutaredoxin n=1 Tax=Rhodocyclus tenuis TaxID=1066 RepID=A0A840G3Z7_RHOTE|nr:glutaredoxin family protein [Rhodocyclus tenuis]MBB4245740.1 glutaredoxin [Rhodocyclus tenuis]